MQPCKGNELLQSYLIVKQASDVHRTCAYVHVHSFHKLLVNNFHTLRHQFSGDKPSVRIRRLVVVDILCKAGSSGVSKMERDVPALVGTDSSFFQIVC